MWQHTSTRCVSAVPLRRTPALLLPLLLVACDEVQSVLAPAGPHADAISILGWVMFIGGGLIFLLVCTLTGIAVLLPAERRQWLGKRSIIIAGGIGLPVVVLTLLLVYGVVVSRSLVLDPAAAPIRIEVIGERWWWRVRYLDEDGNVRFVTANEIRIPVGRPIQFILGTKDVIHSFWVPRLAGKLDMIPGRTTSYTFSADAAGAYRGQCAEYCGAQHALMAFFVVALGAEDFEAWVEDQMSPAEDPVIDFLERGRQLFIANGCGACHTVRGTPAEGELGPDLTHVGSRMTIGAGILPNNVGTLAGWISSVQHLKPDALMPSFGTLEGEQLRAIAAYLESLK